MGRYDVLLNNERKKSYAISLANGAERYDKYHCKNFPKRYAWLSVTFLGFIRFEQVAGNKGFVPENVPDFSNLVDLSE